MKNRWMSHFRFQVHHLCFSRCCSVCCSGYCSVLQCVLQCTDEWVISGFNFIICVSTSLSVRQDSFTRAPRLIHTCAMTHSHVCQDSFTYVPWCIHMCAMTHSYGIHMWLIESYVSSPVSFFFQNKRTLMRFPCVPFCVLCSSGWAGLRKQCATACCSMLQCVAVFCSHVQYCGGPCVLWNSDCAGWRKQCVAVCCCVSLCATVCCCVLLCVAVCCSVLQCVCGMLQPCTVLLMPMFHVCCAALIALVEESSVLQHVAACCSVLQCVAVCWRDAAATYCIVDVNVSFVLCSSDCAGWRNRGA